MKGLVLIGYYFNYCISYHDAFISHNNNKQTKIIRDSKQLLILSTCMFIFQCGIDFTGSNGDPRHSSSLHYTGSVNPNDYVQAIQAVGNIVQDYDRFATRKKVFIKLTLQKFLRIKHPTIDHTSWLLAGNVRVPTFKLFPKQAL